MIERHRNLAPCCALLLFALACDSDDAGDGSNAQGATMAPTDGAGDAADGAAGTDGSTDDGTGDPSAGNADDPAGAALPDYALDDNWLCRPGAPSEACQVPSASDVATDGSLAEVPAPETSDALDCFYVYPTIESSQELVGPVADYSNIDDIRFVAKQQIGSLSSACRVFAPLYHQVGLGTYLDPQAASYLDGAYEEVAAAFEHYLSEDNAGRDFVLVGHSQGTHMLRRLIQRRIETDDAVHAQLALAILLGPLGDIQMPAGASVGGSFERTPLCESADQRGCVITYSSYPADAPPNATFGLFFGGIAEGMDAPCTNPAALAGGKAPSAGVHFPSMAMATMAGTVEDLGETLGVETESAVFRDYFQLECAQNDSGHSFLAVSAEPAAGDGRTDPLLYEAEALFLDLVGLHIYDFSVAIDDLIEQIRARTP